MRPQRPIVSPPPEDEHRVLQFRPRPGSPLAQRESHPPFGHRLEVANDLSRYERVPEEADDYRQRMLANVAAFAFTMALLAIGPTILVGLVLLLYPETAGRELEELNPGDRADAPFGADARADGGAGTPDEEPDAEGTSLHRP